MRVACGNGIRRWRTGFVLAKPKAQWPMIKAHGNPNGQYQSWSWFARFRPIRRDESACARFSSLGGLRGGIEDDDEDEDEDEHEGTSGSAGKLLMDNGVTV